MIASIIKAEGFTHAEFTNSHRDGNVVIGCDCAKPSGELDGCTKQVVIIVGDWFTCANANADVERWSGPYIAFVNASLDSYRKGDGGHNGGEGGHNPIAGVFDLATVMGTELISNNRIVFAEQLHMTFIAELLCLSN